MPNYRVWVHSSAVCLGKSAGDHNLHFIYAASLLEDHRIGSRMVGNL